MNWKTLFYFSAVSILISCNGNSSNPEKEDILTADATAETQVTETIINRPEIVEFNSLDGLLITGVLYEIDTTAETILLCHQAGYNMHEYDEIAPQLNELGYNCLAIDQRSGGILNDFVNQTADRAITDALPVQFVDAEQDIIASIDFAYKRSNKKIILWGSSYSSALALHLAEENQHALKAVISFSPGDYFGDEKPTLKTAMHTFNLPFFITSSKSESEAITAFLDNTNLDDSHVHFTPEATGKHGSKALWSEHEANQEYWKALKEFLAAI